MSLPFLLRSFSQPALSALPAAPLSLATLPVPLTAPAPTSNTLAGLALGSEGVSSEDVLQVFGRDTLSSNPESWKQSVENKIASLTARLANATARGLFQEATLLGADWADFKEDYRGIYTQFVDHGMAHKEVMQLVALRHQSARHKLMVDIMSMLYPALKAQLFSPTVGVARPSLPSFTAPTVPSNRHAHLQCNFCNGMGRISPNCPARQRDRRDLVKGTVPGARGAPSATLLLVHLVLRV
jgi:hypothetical protein